MAARGLDVNNIDIIVHWHCRQVDSFVHRSGRTGRAGKSGINIAMIEKADFPFYRTIEDNLNININFINSLKGTDLLTHTVDNKGILEK